MTYGACSYDMEHVIMTYGACSYDMEHVIMTYGACSYDMEHVIMTYGACSYDIANVTHFVFRLHNCGTAPSRTIMNFSWDINPLAS